MSICIIIFSSPRISDPKFLVILPPLEEEPVSISDKDILPSFIGNDLFGVLENTLLMVTRLCFLFLSNV